MRRSTFAPDPHTYSALSTCPRCSQPVGAGAKRVSTAEVYAGSGQRQGSYFVTVNRNTRDAVPLASVAVSSEYHAPAFRGVPVS